MEASLDKAAREFFQQPRALKRRTTMDRGGVAWRGYFEVGDELTSGAPDLKEGLYFGSELPLTDSRVKAKLPMHGPNLWPATLPEELVTGAGDASSSSSSSPSSTMEGESNAEEKYSQYLAARRRDQDLELKQLVLTWIDTMRNLGFVLMEGIARSLQLEPDFFAQTYMSDPLMLFRIFNYPDPSPLVKHYDEHGALPEPTSSTTTMTVSSSSSSSLSSSMPKKRLWSVGEHTDYGMLTILRQDTSGGLQVRRVEDGEWIDAPPIANTFVVNIGDMLEKMTGGIYLSTPHRVLNPQARDRISFPFFFDPNFEAMMDSLVDVSPRLKEIASAKKDKDASSTASIPSTTSTSTSTYRRWDGKEIGLRDFTGTYGQYVLSKVAKVFPQLAQQEQIEK